MIRLATREDASGIAEIHVASWRVAYRDILPAELLLGLDVKDRQRLWSDLCSRSDVSVFVAEDEGLVSGFCHVCRCRDTDLADSAEITCLYISPGWERRGIGRQLMLAALAYASRGGFPRASLWVLRENLAARLFYEALGFRPDDTVKTETFSGCTLHEMRYIKNR
ncbi:MAG: GNAT family N-acetyltransferase [Verrucomicrobiota bacterium]